VILLKGQTRSAGLKDQKFHSSKQWQKLSKDFKTLKCVDCGKSEDIEAGHILPASRFKMSRLWKSNLVAQCRACNAKLGDKIRWSIRSIQLLVVYGMIKILMYSVIILIAALLARYIYLDITYNASTITDQMQYEVIEYYNKLRRLS